ncbi:hypothetical protein F66182_5532 [Fusarium sp. NRRL 66182]|nr:hypothetical protein F66182_5532 [Fusarium sp. NRRL 66182]
MAGGKKFSRDIRPVDADGNEVSMWAVDNNKDDDEDDEEEESSEEESTQDEDSDEEDAGTSKAPAQEASREARKAEKKARKEAAIARQRAKTVEVGDLPSSDEDEDSDEDDDMPANPNHSKQARKQAAASGGVDDITEGVENLSAAPSRREREALEAAAAKEKHMRLTAQGKTDEAKADLARLKAIREQRALDASRRQAEREEREEQEKVKKAEFEAREARKRETAAKKDLGRSSWFIDHERSVGTYLGVQDRLRDHAKAFDGLLSLIPAKMYYGEDTSDQWNKKKQTKEEAAAARRGKLDPDSELNRNAKEVMDERAKNKRKLREIEQQDDAEEDDWDEYEPVPGVDSEKPREGLKAKTADANKKQKLDDDEDDTDPKTTAEANPSKLSRKDEKKAKKKEKKAEKKTKQAEAPEAESTGAPAPTPKAQKQAAKKQAKKSAAKAQKQEEGNEDVDETPATRDDGEVLPMDISGMEKEEEVSGNSSHESEPQSPTFDTNDASTNPTETTADPASTTTSVSSTIPPSEKPKHIKLPADTSAIRARLAARIEALRAARKADGPDGRPIRTRQELIESRRKKQELRKAHKQEMRQQAKLEEQRKREEALASSSPGVMSPAVELDEAASNFTFGRVSFGDGAQLSRDLGHVLTQGKKKGPSDPKTALIKVQNQKKRLQELDDEKRADIAEKDVWLNARRRAEGEKIRDDEALLKRAVKRKEVAKKKSEKAWRERSDGVKMAQKDRQRKREENLRQRRDDKLLGKAGKKKKKGGAAGAKKKSRPGFEGSLGVGGRKK